MDLEKSTLSEFAPAELSLINATKPNPVGMVRRRRRRFQPGPPPPPTLYDKLVETEKIEERGLLLQAIRFFVSNNYLIHFTTIPSIC
jgi:hypothetical protein